MNFPELKFQSLFENEEAVLKYWQENQVFAKSLEKNPKDDIYSFYDGPPFITGLPHYATLLPSIAKDIIPRYQTMKGKYVRRVWGWDCHGLPAENQVEKQLGLKSKRDIETYGIDKFVTACRTYVSEGSSAWRWYIDHIGRWVDMDNAYRTDSLPFMETVISAFKQLYDKELIYKGRRVSLYCSRCATPLSKFEVTMDDDTYKMVEDPAITVAFKLKDDDAFLLAWTTTPWTLPANLALAVKADADYAKVKKDGKFYILAKSRLEEFGLDEIVEDFKGEKLVGKEYEPLFKYFETKDKDYHVYAADFVTLDDGTGIVHIAPGFGEDDTTLGDKEGLSIILSLDDEGKFVEQAKPWAGLRYKEADNLIIEDLKNRQLLFDQKTITHSYPHCHRCSTPLIYKSQVAWYVKIEPLRQELLEGNKDINWVPEYFKEGRFAYNVENAPDWSISRTRYWGTPIPVWETDDGEMVVVGSIEELEKLSGQKIGELHRPDIDNIEITTPSGKKAHRVKEVFDSWFESGSMPYGQFHYPFENKEEFEKSLPCDFIVEYTGQLRGWFYYLHVLSHALFQKNAFKNVVVTGVLGGTDGRKMSKSYGNYPDPKGTIEKFGAESLRLYFMNSKIMNGEDTSISEDDIREEYRLLNILWNSYRYFVTYANLHNFEPNNPSLRGVERQSPAPSGAGRSNLSNNFESSDTSDMSLRAERSNLSDSTSDTNVKNDEVYRSSDSENTKSKNILDVWIETRLEELISQIKEGLDTYQFPVATRAIRPFIEDLSTWYIRRSRDRFVEGDTDALNTLFGVLKRFSLAVAPILPFSAESIYRALTADGDSVHLQNYPDADMGKIEGNKKLLEQMDQARQAASAVHMLRADAGHSLRQKLAKVSIKGLSLLSNSPDLIDLLKSEVNVESVELVENSRSNFACTELGEAQVCLDVELTAELKEEGMLREIVRGIQDSRKKVGLRVGETAVLSYSAQGDVLALIQKRAEEIKKSAGISELNQSDPAEDWVTILDNLKIKISK